MPLGPALTGDDSGKVTLVWKSTETSLANIDMQKYYMQVTHDVQTEESILRPFITVKKQEGIFAWHHTTKHTQHCLLYTSPSPRDRQKSRMPSSA